MRKSLEASRSVTWGLVALPSPLGGSRGRGGAQGRGSRAGAQQPGPGTRDGEGEVGGPGDGSSG